MSDYPTYRKVVAVCACAGNGEAVYCDDGSVWYFLLNADAPRVPLEGTPVPGSARAAELASDFVALKVPEWEATARNLAQVLSNTARWLREVQRGEADISTLNATQLETAFPDQARAHGLSV